MAGRTPFSKLTENLSPQRRADIRISSLQKMIEAMDGSLEIKRIFPGATSLLQTTAKPERANGHCW